MINNDITYFVAWCIEQYKVHLGVDGEAAMALLDRYGLLDYLAENYEVLHTQSRQWLMEELSLLVDQRKEVAV